MKAKERHELKQNEFAETAMQVLAWVSANRERAIGIGIAAVAIVAVIAGYGWYRQNATNEAGAALGAAAATAQAPIAPAPTVPGAAQQSGTFPTEAARLEATLSAYRKVVDEFPGTKAALTAKYTIGVLLLDAGRAQEAEQAFGDVVDSAGDSFYEPLARLGRAQALLAQQKYDDAIAIFTELSADRTSQLPLDGVLIQLARACAKADRTDDARAAFKRIVDEFPESNYAGEARQEMVRLG